jgi:ABC-type transporter Mla MlaB component
VRDSSNWITAVQWGAGVSSGEAAYGGDVPLLQIELLESPSGCLARLSGDLVGETTAGLWSIEPMLTNEARVVLDLSGITTIDSAGLEATLRLMDAIRNFGGRLTIGHEHVSANLGGRPTQPGSMPYHDGASTLLPRRNVCD